MTGRVLLDGEDIYAPGVDVTQLRRRVGMVFALPLPLPGTVRDNVLYGPRLAGERDAARLSEIVERSLQQAALWTEVKDRLDAPALSLSGGQQQRLCIARSLALEPEVLLLDEPTSGLDPISTAKVEESLFELRERYAVVIVPHSVQQAARVADYAAFFLSGEMVESGDGPAGLHLPARHEDGGLHHGEVRLTHGKDSCPRPFLFLWSAPRLRRRQHRHRGAARSPRSSGHRDAGSPRSCGASTA